MTKAEAIQAMKDGQKVTHRYFTPEEYIFMKGSHICTEDGASCFSDEFWEYRTSAAFDTDWSLYNAPLETLTLKEYASRVGYPNNPATLDEIQDYVNDECNISLWDYPLNELDYCLNEAKNENGYAYVQTDFGMRICDL